MTTPHTVSRTGTVAAPVGDVFQAGLSLPLPQLYARRYGLIPAIVAVRDQQGEWGTVGQTRVFETADRGAMREELLTIDRPHGFSNRLTVLGGPFLPLVGTIEESWTFREAGGATQATWEWNLYPCSRAGRLLAPVVGRMWLGYAGRVLEQLSYEVTGSRNS